MHTFLIHLLISVIIIPQVCSQINSVGIGLGIQHAKRVETHSTSTYTLNDHGYPELTHTYMPVEAIGTGAEFNFTGNMSILGWLINNAWNDLNRGFYIGDYFDASGGFGPFGTKKNGINTNELLLRAAFGLGIQTGYKIPTLPAPASIDVRWYLSGTFNNMRAYKMSSMGGNYDDFLNLGLTCRYGILATRIDYGYKHHKGNHSSFEINSRRFFACLYWQFDTPKERTHWSHNSAIGIRYEGFYNYYFNNYMNALNGRNHNISIELLLMKF
jgi:hypothetical protein